MTLATAPRTLGRELTDRALEEFANPATSTASDVEDAMHYIVDMVAGDYRIFDDPDVVDAHVVANTWVERVRAALLTSIMDDVRATLIPRAAVRMAALLAQDPPPAHLVAHEHSQRLRDDLELLQRS